MDFIGLDFRVTPDQSSVFLDRSNYALNWILDVMLSDVNCKIEVGTWMFGQWYNLEPGYSPRASRGADQILAVGNRTRLGNRCS